MVTGKQHNYTVIIASHCNNPCACIIVLSTLSFRYVLYGAFFIVSVCLKSMDFFFEFHHTGSLYQNFIQALRISSAYCKVVFGFQKSNPNSMDFFVEFHTGSLYHQNFIRALRIISSAYCKVFFLYEEDLEIL